MHRNGFAAPNGSALPQLGPLHARLHSGRLLCVDDNPLNTLLLQEFFRMRGFPPVRVASSVREAVAMAQAEPPLAVLLDLNLSDGSGLEVLARLRAHPATHDVPVAIVSGSIEEDERAAAMALGAQAWWPKPLDLSTLDERLDLLF
ncbi:response regulator [Aquabacterium sp.]|uniref:response regulator n=1 Tax=Aquabacterium sp. TaxID=1872578 RepID=UPI002C9C6763|nr:response regulator [Aquabacterium sp.]HSW06193.1 response regulator [Aquabacterium sp.]